MLALFVMHLTGTTTASAANLLINESVGFAQVIRLEGLNSSRAHVIAERTAGNARDYCMRYRSYLVRKGGELKACVQQDLTLTASTPYEASADCPAGIIAASNGFVFKKRDDRPADSGPSLEQALRILEPIGAYGTSLSRDSYRVGLSQFRLLCPGFAH